MICSNSNSLTHYEWISEITHDSDPVHFIQLGQPHVIVHSEVCMCVHNK